MYIYMSIIMIWQNAFYKWIRDNLSNWNCWIMSAFSVFPVLIYNRHFNLRYLSQESLSVFRFYFNRDKSNELYLLATCNGQWYFLYTLCLENLFFGDNNLRFFYMFSWLLKAAAFSSDRPCIALRSFFKSNLLSLRNGKILLYLLLFFFSFFGSVSLLFLKASHCWKILKNKQRPIPRGQSPSFILNFLMLNPFFRETFWYKG